MSSCEMRKADDDGDAKSSKVRAIRPNGNFTNAKLNEISI